MTDTAVLRARMDQAGLTDVDSIEPAIGGLAAVAGLATRRDGSTVFVKTFTEPVADDLFAVEADGLAALRAAGAVTPDVLAVTPDLLALTALRPRPDGPQFWERLAHVLARLHTSTPYGRFGWHRDNWLGRRPQDNTWHDDGHEFFAHRRVLRWLPERRVQAALSPADRDALERLCERLPELLPVRPACLTHGDLWSQNILATADGRPALIDPAVSYTWAEVDLSMLWSSPRPAASDRFFTTYAELTGLDEGWRARMPLLHLRQHLAVIAQFDHDWGAADAVRALVAPFRRTRA